MTRTGGYIWFIASWIPLSYYKNSVTDVMQSTYRRLTISNAWKPQIYFLECQLAVNQLSIVTWNLVTSPPVWALSYDWSRATSVIIKVKASNRNNDPAGIRWIDVVIWSASQIKWRIWRQKPTQPRMIFEGVRYFIKVHWLPYPQKDSPLSPSRQYIITGS